MLILYEAVRSSGEFIFSLYSFIFWLAASHLVSVVTPLFTVQAVFQEKKWKLRTNWSEEHLQSEALENVYSGAMKSDEEDGNVKKWKEEAKIWKGIFGDWEEVSKKWEQSAENLEQSAKNWEEAAKDWDEAATKWEENAMEWKKKSSRLSWSWGGRAEWVSVADYDNRIKWHDSSDWTSKFQGCHVIGFVWAAASIGMWRRMRWIIYNL